MTRVGPPDLWGATSPIGRVRPQVAAQPNDVWGEAGRLEFDERCRR